ncbi:MAG TPA: FtsX-like permease family protein [Balneolales bacterium]|nr:FtsX-like permease family protein [Balneolales bacterium]
MRYLFRHPWQFGLSFLGVAIGVALILSIDISNQSAERAFSLSSQMVTGKATDQITAGSGGIQDSLYRRLRLNLRVPMAPVVETYVQTPDHPGYTLHLLGIDPFSEPLFRPYLSEVRDGNKGSLRNFLTGKHRILIPSTDANTMKLTTGDTLKLRISAKTIPVVVSGIIKPANDFNKTALSNLLIADISTVQNLTGRYHTISHIDLIIPENKRGDQIRAVIRKMLPSDVTLQPASDSQQTLEKMSEAFRLNLSALSKLGLLVSMFLIYNIMTFSVVQRRGLIGRLRAIGYSRSQIFQQIIGEAFIIGIIGTAIGIGGGILLARELIHLITRTINDLYYVVSVRELHIPLFTLVKGILLGVGATVAAAIFPALEATNTEPGIMLRFDQSNENIHRRLSAYNYWGSGLLAAGVLFLWIPEGGIGLSYFALLLVILGFSLLTPGAVSFFANVIRPVLKQFSGVAGAMAARSIRNHLSRTSVAIAALMIAVSAIIGLGVMVTSFRETLSQWLTTTLRADIYISPPSPVANQPMTYLDSSFQDRFLKIPGVRSIGTIGRYHIPFHNGRLEIAVANIPTAGHQGFRFKSGNAQTIWKDFKNGQIIISEPFAFKHHVSTGDTLQLPTDGGTRSFRIAGVYFDYASDEGVVLMDRSVYQKYWHFKGITGISLYLKKGFKLQNVIPKVRKAAGSNVLLNIRSNRELREQSLKIFDRTFTITTVLQILIALVAFVGVFSALMALQLEKERELSILRALGFTPSQVRTLITTETGLMGLIAGILAIPVGLVLAWALIYVINQRSFGWTFQFVVPSIIIIRSLLVAILAALLASWYPGKRMSRSSLSRIFRDV